MIIPLIIVIRLAITWGVTMTDVFPEAERRECFIHLMQNYIKKFFGKEHMYPASRAYKR
jgi:hypothetical protein